MLFACKSNVSEEKAFSQELTPKKFFWFFAAQVMFLILSKVKTHLEQNMNMITKLPVEVVFAHQSSVFTTSLLVLRAE